MTSRVIVTYLLGIGLALALVNVAQADPEPEPDNGGTSVDIETDVDPAFKFDQLVNVVLEAGQTIVEVCQNIFGYHDPEKVCCYVDDVKYDNGEEWYSEEKGDCICVEGQAQCTLDNMTYPSEDGTTPDDVESTTA